MDKWDEIVNRVKQGMLAEEPEAALAGGLQLLAEFGRTFEQIGAAVERIAASLGTGYGDEGGIPPELQHDEPVAEHDL